VKTARRKVAAAAAAGALLLAGCAGGATSAPAAQEAVQADVQVVLDAFEASIAAGSAQLTGTVSTNAGGQASTFTFDGPQSFDPPATAITVASDAFGGVELQQVLVGGELFVQVPELDGKWIKLPLADFAGAANPYFAPKEDLADLVDLQQVGTGSESGVAVTYYQATVDLGAAIAGLGLPPQVLAGVRDRLGAEPGQSTVRIAIDEAGRLVSWDQDTAIALADGSTVTAKAELDWSAFGEPVTVTAPPAADVTDAGALGGLLPGLLPTPAP
jgi:hypothetical protein